MKRVILFLFFLCLCTSFSFASTTLVLQDANTEVLEDAFVDESAPDTVNGSSTKMPISYTPNADTELAYIMFNLPLPEYIQILDAYLNITFDFDHRVYEVRHVYLSNWSENSLTWNNQPCGDDISNSNNCNLTMLDSYTSGGAGSGGRFDFNVTSAIIYQYNNNKGNISFVFNTTDTSGSRIYSKENGNANNPKLVIIYNEDVPSINSNVTYPSEPLYLSNTTIQVNATSYYGIIWANFTLIAPNGTWIINNSNGTNFENDLWNSTTFIINTEGQWNISIKVSTQNYTTEKNWSFTITDDPPELANVSISPTTTNYLADLNCTYVYTDNETNPETDRWFIWYFNGTATGNTTQILTSGNTSVGDNWSCSVMVSDGLKNSTVVMSSNVTIVDNVNPLVTDWQLSASSGYTDTEFQIFVNCSDTASSISTVLVEFLNPNGENVGNKTMNLSTGSRYEFNYTFNVVGTYVNFTFHCADQSGNINRTSTSLTFTASTRPSETPPGGGGGDTILPKQFKLNATSLMITTPIGVPKSFPFTITNTGDEDGYFIPVCEGEACNWVSFPSKRILVNKNMTVNAVFDIRATGNVSIGNYTLTITGNDVVTGLHYNLETEEYIMFSILMEGIDVPLIGIIAKWVIVLLMLVPTGIAYWFLSKTEMKFWIVVPAYLVAICIVLFVIPASV